MDLGYNRLQSFTVSDLGCWRHGMSRHAVVIICLLATSIRHTVSSTQSQLIAVRLQRSAECAAACWVSAATRTCLNCPSQSGRASPSPTSSPSPSKNTPRYRPRGSHSDALLSTNSTNMYTFYIGYQFMIVTSLRYVSELQGGPKTGPQTNDHNSVKS